jgi:hypothetical protein
MFTDDDLAAMSLDELWLFRRKTSQILFARLRAQRREINAKLAILRRALSDTSVGEKAKKPHAAVGRGKPLAVATIKHAGWMLFAVLTWALTESS